MRTRIAFPSLAASLLLFVAVAPPAWSQQNSTATKLDELLTHFASNHKFMGSVAVSKDGKQLFAKQYGISQPAGESNSSPNDQTQYRIGSITKSFTAVMIMQLVEEGKLSLDTKLSKFFPELNKADQITIRQLLGHESGLGSITDDPTYGDWNQQQQTRQQMMKIIASQPKRFEPGEKTQYSNTNFVLLGYIIEDLTDSSYAEQLQTRICERAGLSRTAYMTMSDASANIARSFRRGADDWKPHEQTDPSIPHGAGAIMSTAGDLTRFAQALFDGKLVSKSSLDEMKPAELGMGRGLFSFPFGQKRAFGHNGGIDGFQSNLGYFPEDKIAVAVLTNGIDYQLNGIMIGILSTVFQQPYQLPNLKAAKVSQETLEQYVGVYARDNFPLKLTFTISEGQLIAQATGQAAFPVSAASETEFRFDAAGVVFNFSRSEDGGGFDTVNLKQAGQDLEFRKE